MTRKMARLAAMVAALWVGTTSAVADDAVDTCAVPDDIFVVNYPFDHVYARLQAKAPLRILIVGSTSSVSSTIWASKGLASAFKAYPRLLEGALQSRLPGAHVSVTDRTAPGMTAPMIQASLSAEVSLHHPDLVVWEAGTTDAVRKLDVNLFGDAITHGLRDLHGHGIDVVLIDIQYSPQTDSIYDFRPYLDYMWRVGEAEDANVLHRYDIMQYYVEAGLFDPAAPAPSDQLRNANFVHGRLAKLLASMILTAAQQP